MGKTSIEWTDYTWPIVNGCRRISAGCGGPDGGGCYAERLAATRLSRMPKYQGLATMRNGRPSWTGEARLWEPHLDMPLRLRKPSKIFVADMGDLFYDGVPESDIDRVFAVMALAPQHCFQVLTKRPERMRAYLSNTHGPDNVLVRILDAARSMKKPRNYTHTDGPGWPYRNVWLGVSCEDQATADERIPLLLQTPAAVRFVSYEPALGPVDFDVYVWPGCISTKAVHDEQHDAGLWCEERSLDWIIVGGESGPGARPFDLAWARSVVGQCREAGAACFMKQLGARPTGWWSNSLGPTVGKFEDKKGADWSEWPEDLRIREFPK